MTSRLTQVACVFRIHLARLRAEAGPFVLAALVFPAGMYLFVSAVGNPDGVPDSPHRLRFLAGSIVFSVSLTAISWLGYLLLENRFTGRLKLFATLPLAPSSYVAGIVAFSLVQAALATTSLLAVARAFGVSTQLTFPGGGLMLASAVTLTTLTVCGIAVIIAARARSFSEGALLTDGLGAGLVLLAPIYTTPEALPRVLRILSSVLPTTYAGRAVQSTLSGNSHVGVELITLGGMAVLTLALGFHLMRWREE